MRYFLLLTFLTISMCAHAQNRIITPTGQSLRLAATEVIANRNLTLDSGYLSLSTYRFLTLRPGSTGLNVFGGPNSGNLTATGRWNTAFGESTGAALTSGINNTFFGALAGAAVTTAANNTFIGSNSGLSTSTGQYNVFVGNQAGQSNTTSNSNVMLGSEAGLSSTGASNLFAGYRAGYSNGAGNNNVYLGWQAGFNNSGSSNVFIGNSAGSFPSPTTVSNQLYIANGATTTPLIYGEFATTSPAYAGKLVFNSRVGVGVTNFPTQATAVVGGSSTNVNVSGYKVFIDGGLLVKELTISNSWADYVFEKGYRLAPLTEVEEYIKAHGHLPNMPAAREIEQHGMNVGDVARSQQEKIEELTLYMIELDKQVKKNDALIQEQGKGLEQIRGLLNRLEQR